MYGNTFLVRNDYGLRCNYGGSQGLFINNIVLGDAAYGAGIEDGACGLTIDHNLYFHTSGDFAFLLDGSVVDFAAWQAAHDGNSLVGDPLLADGPAGDVHLQVGSPARDQGDDAYAAGVDYYGSPRVQGPRVDIGAAEFAVAAGGGAGEGGFAGAGGAAGSAGDGGLTGGAGGHAGSAVAPGADQAESESGCGCTVPGPPSGHARAMAIAAFAVAVMRRQPRRRGARASQRSRS